MTGPEQTETMPLSDALDLRDTAFSTGYREGMDQARRLVAAALDLVEHPVEAVS